MSFTAILGQGRFGSIPHGQHPSDGFAALTQLQQAQLITLLNRAELNPIEDLLIRARWGIGVGGEVWSVLHLAADQSCSANDIHEQLTAITNRLINIMTVGEQRWLGQLVVSSSD